MKADDPLEDFARRDITLNEATKRVYVAGHGPAVIVMTEMPGISPHVARFARWVRDAGFTVYMPSLFGRDGAFPDAERGLAVLQRACISAEFRAFASWLPPAGAIFRASVDRRSRAAPRLSRHESGRCACSC